MEKNWIIRSRKNYYTQIVGPVSRAKIIELKDAQVLNPDVEICSGNGFWFWIKEDDLYQRYVIDEEIQSFDPISEAVSISNTDDTKRNTRNKKSGDPINSDITIVGGIAISALNSEQAEDKSSLPSDEDLEFPEMGKISFDPIEGGVSTAKYEEEVVVISEHTGEHLNHNIALPTDEDLAFPDLKPAGLPLSGGSGDIMATGIDDIPPEAVEETGDIDHSQELKKSKKNLPKKKQKKKVKKSKARGDRRDRHEPKRNDKLFLLFAAALIFILLIIGYFYLGSNAIVKVSNKLVATSFAQEVQKKK